MLSKIIQFTIKNKFIVLLFTVFLIGFGIYSLSQISIGAVPDVTNNQVQVITTSRNLSTQDIEQFITYPVELEMANLPGVKEIRSISKFGLSVVTIVFEESMGTYLPRQLIAEKIKAASEKIPEGFGSPEMGPITTGLGEIYQYILDVKPQFKDRYTSTDLRTIQDWIVKRQLSGISGVVEVNTWGGHLKQYEVAINTQKLNAMNISAKEVFTALENNNSVTGGGYIEKVNQSYFIRGEGLVKTLNDIKDIVVTNKTGIPVYVKDIADVGYGSATRFGAITANGEGEKVLGQVMMLKNASSKDVIEAVKERVAIIEKTLPEGVFINPFLERSELIGKTTFTITENLLLGCLIVILVVVLLLGNIRSGLVVASVIPLSLLFTLSLMYIFGIDANLMSLGAIDFGIIIDGAVIIVEYITFKITQQKDTFITLNKKEKQKIKDNVSNEGASKMMNSAVFGQLIILIVFIPILSLSGVEGKMFKPMALVFSFALIGAILLCLTYVPVMSSLFLKPSNITDKNISVRLINKLNQRYIPIIDWALKHKNAVFGIASFMLLLSVFIYSRMGGEFVPTLDEGDFVIQPVLKTGTTLSNTIETTTKIEKILKENFPEVKQVVSRIGAAEVPTDPMSMEESDVIITLNPKSEWTSAKSKDELADKFKEALSIIPGMEVEFTQPIEMRFNELITGVRADIAIKIFGEDLSVLARKGNEIKRLVENVAGASDIVVEKIEGLPQMNVAYNRAKIARYQLNINEVNEIVSMGFAGRTVGNVFEGEKRFDLVVRLDESKRTDISDLKELYIDLPNGGKIPLEELATISYQKGAAKISRDDTKRRLVVGINVRNRDLQSVVDDVQRLIGENIKLPTGYSITYGGQFENLQSASKRLMIAVPIALILIFIMLYFAFKSVKEALIIYSAIPFAAIGGVLLLWFRDLPFSISAGVGFIALFGIAVLNGIVLIEHFKELKHKEFTSVEALVKHGATNRLRAVLLTATAAALGFLPMAISTNAGAEVQRPLATVVIGGLVTSTLLTLVVLPVLYSIFHKPKKIKINKKTASLFVVFLLGGLYTTIQAQQAQENLRSLIDLAIVNNKGLQAQELKVKKAQAAIASAYSFDKTEVYYNRDENNTVANQPLDIFGIQQNFDFPTVYSASKKVQKSVYNLQKNQFQTTKKRLIKSVVNGYYTYQYVKVQESIYKSLDSLYNKFSYAAKRRFDLGETNYLEKITAQAKHKQIKNDYRKKKVAARIAYQKIQALVQSKDSLDILEEKTIQPLEIQHINLNEITEIQEYFEKEQLAKRQLSQQKQQLLPGFSLEVFGGSNKQVDKNFYGYQIGVKIPLLFGGATSKIKQSKIAKDIAESETSNYKKQLQVYYKNLQNKLEESKTALAYYIDEGLPLANEILKTANTSFKHGEIDFFQYIQSIENAYQIKLAYVKNIEAYNNIVIDINYLTY
ncbi:CusA/CzcA family heavy metal efflux RND transporter [Tenacibaculum tangerinum]|uniref:CusA/CzcA family heavy metal efflux RND transporter n=1 Tax=Tenacibaculum tangerinum TaxID=3038772 RepID=A0ABY8L433_9FLAO|nr:CusA/CzcA family heavy metal efflux RND transporter [Tenacibaculum tangerinum]WGH76193.1 CusA/CzcA family heavy metal efflux RND transporter [Tenacibaculum tangerinum]